MMHHSIASIGSKSTPPPPHNRHSHHRKHNRSRNMLAIQKDINPATYYDHVPKSHSPRGFNTHTSSTSNNPTSKSPSQSCRNLLPSPTHIHSHSHSVNSENDIGIQHQQAHGAASASLMDLFSYTEQNMVSQTQQMSISEAFADNYNEFNNHNEFILNPNSSWSDLYGNMKTKTQNKSNKKQYKNAKIKNNISNYMAFMSSIEHDGDGEYSDHEEGRDTLYIESESDTESNYTTETPLQTAFDSVNDIFNLLPNDNNNNNNNIDEIKEFSKTMSNENEIQIENSNEGIQNDTNNGTINKKERDKAVYNRLREILSCHDLDNLSSDNSDAVFSKIDSLCLDLKHKKTKVQNIEDKYQDLSAFLDELQNENELLKRKNSELVNKLTLNDVTTDGILRQLCEYLKTLKNEIFEINYNNINNNMISPKIYNNFKIKLQSTYESLSDLANDLNSQTLKIAVKKVNKSIGDITFLQHHKLYRISNLENIINNLSKDLNRQINKNANNTPGGNNLSEEIINKYPQFISDEKEKKEFENDIIFTNKLTKYGIFDDEFPTVTHIDIYGGWFNKKSRAVIKYKNEIFYRKEADFKWLYKMIRVNGNNNNDNILPDYPKELPQVLWPNNYLNKRKSELNLFLMQCHSLKNIKNSNPWNIFLQDEKKNWKEKRDKYDKIMLKKIKSKSILEFE